MLLTAIYAVSVTIHLQSVELSYVGYALIPAIYAKSIAYVQHVLPHTHGNPVALPVFYVLLQVVQVVQQLMIVIYVKMAILEI